MSETSSIAGYLVIVVIYASVGVFTVLGSIFATQKTFSPRNEQVFYGLFLVAIAGFYLAFCAHFGAEQSLPMEWAAVVFFATLGLAGTRLAPALILGYPLHAVWDLLHEFLDPVGAALFAPELLTPIPLGYGVFCLVFDVGIAIYFVRRRKVWAEDWKRTRRSTAAVGS